MTNAPEEADIPQYVVDHMTQATFMLRQLSLATPTSPADADTFNKMIKGIAFAVGWAHVRDDQMTYQQIIAAGSQLMTNHVLTADD